MEARVLRIETPESFTRAVNAAVEMLREGEVVALPTETVYGLAANALDAEAVEKIYRAKGRPAHNPIIVHVASHAMARECVAGWPETATKVAQRFWPGPLTLVLPKAVSIPDIVSAGGATVGIRWPLHPLMQEVIRRCGFPLAAPSANRSNEISPTSAEHVVRSLGGEIPLIIDAGPSNVGIESTVLDLSGEPLRVLRPGMVSRGELEGVLGCPVVEATAQGGALKSPGLLKRHYSPRAKLIVRTWRDEAELREIAKDSGVPIERVHVLAHEVVPRANPFGRVSVIPQDAEAYARALYDELHRCDELGARLIIVEALPEGDGWEAIRDRLNRASAEPEST